MESGVANLPAPNMEMMDAPGYADGGIVAFSGAGSVRLTPEELETNRLREQIRRRYAFTTSPLGAFTPVASNEIIPFQEKRRGLQDVLGALPNLNREQLEQLDVSLQAMDQRPLTANKAAPAAAKPPAAVDLARDFKDTDTRVDLAAKPPSAPPSAPPGGDNAPRPVGVASLFGQTKDFMSQFGGAPSAEKVPTVAEAGAERMQAYKDAGVDFAANDELRNKILEGVGERNKEKTEAGLMALAQFGFTLASTPGSFLSAVGQAGGPALKQYAGEIKDLKKAAREDDKLLAQLKQNDNALRMGVTDKGLEDRQKIMDRIETNRLNSIRTAGSVFGGIATLQASRESTAASTAAAKETRELNELGRKKDIALRETNDALLKEMTTNPLLAQDPVAYNRRKNALYAENLALLQSKESTGPATPMGKVVNGVYVLNPPAGK
jgi:hypothetical protein